MSSHTFKVCRTGDLGVAEGLPVITGLGDCNDRAAKTPERKEHAGQSTFCGEQCRRSDSACAKAGLCSNAGAWPLQRRSWLCPQGKTAPSCALPAPCQGFRITHPCLEASQKQRSGLVIYMLALTHRAAALCHRDGRGCTADVPCCNACPGMCACGPQADSSKPLHAFPSQDPG